MRKKQDARTGEYAAHFWSASPFAFTLSQTVTGLEEGSYVARGSMEGEGEDAASTVLLSLANSDGDTESSSFSLDGWLRWSTPTTGAVTIADGGTATVTVTASLPGEAWGTIDDLELVRAPAAGADTGELQTAIDRARALNRSVFSEESLAELDRAVEIGEVVLGALSPTQQSTDYALAALNEAFDGLELIGEVPPSTVTPVSLTVIDGDPIELPAEVTVTAYDGEVTEEAVTWSSAVQWIAGTGD